MNERIADILGKMAALGIGNYTERKWRGSAPLAICLFNDRRRLEALGMPWDVKAWRATNYAHWLRNHPSFECSYCGKVIPNSSRSRHADHFVPLSKGGRHSPENIIPSCQRCNVSKFVKILDKPPAIPEHLSIASWMWVNPEMARMATVPAFEEEPAKKELAELVAVKKGVRGPNDWDEAWFEEWCRSNSDREPPAED